MPEPGWFYFPDGPVPDGIVRVDVFISGPGEHSAQYHKAFTVESVSNYLDDAAEFRVAAKYQFHHALNALLNAMETEDVEVL